MFRKVLIANRGEIAVRIARTLHELGIAVVAVYSDADRSSLHVRIADEAYPIGPAPAAESYLCIDRLLETAHRAGVDAIHPGYGFLSESHAFAQACEQRGVTFIGPPAAAIAAMGSKPAARAKMAAAGVPITPGGAAASLSEAMATAAGVGYPVLIKAAAGGGGKGIRLVKREEELHAALERARSEAERSFGDPLVYLEKAIINARHVEIQILGDREGNLIHLFERDCSLQRRHQKVVEETPAPNLSTALIRRMGDVAIAGARSVGYHSAGTFEFLVDEEEHFYFLEMNTRLQVEHPITEWVTGIDLVAEMVRIAAGEPLQQTQGGVCPRGAAIECRICAEDPDLQFVPSPGPLHVLRPSVGPWVRDDAGYAEDDRIPGDYDPLIAKLSVWGPDRRTAMARMRRALGEYVVLGVRTNLAFHQVLMTHPAFVRGHYDTTFLDRHHHELTARVGPEEDDREAVAIALSVEAYEGHGEATSVNDAPSVPSPWVTQYRGRWSG